ncbi:lipase family protein [Longimicrobium sp.]|uniref:lipase family protein n=1 Tax=Longimicrobium sp. TaxID=2029185 RepID=UPI002E3643A1|nr:hypothetical protein [Longimicrobium sp.]HEX6037445.1 hypothetical protein [Longimicrobium sp.]
MSNPTHQQSVIYQLSMYAALVDDIPGPNLEPLLYQKIQAALQADAGEIGNWSVAWGPVAVQLNTSAYAVNAMYVAESKDTPGSYVVGIAGTNPSSVFDWVVEDGLVSVQLPWIYGLFSAPDARIALGTGIGLAILQNAAPGSGIPGTGTTLLEFMQGIPKEGTSVVVSGHSLGGALSPTVALWLHDVRLLWDPFSQVALSTLPTAGPTAGNAAFAAYSNEKLPTTRFANAIDVVPHAWQASDLAAIPTLYAPDIQPDDLINDLVHVAETISAAGGYTQLVDDAGWFPASVDTSIITPGAPVIENFFYQLAYQHTTAYHTFFGVVSPTLHAWAARFQAAVTAQGPALAMRVAAGAAAAAQATAPVNGRPTVIPPASDPASAQVAARVLADLMRHATPDQQRVGIPVDPQSLVDTRAGAAQP